MTRHSPTVRIVQEEEAPRAWRFTVEVNAERHSRTIQIELGWADYDHWSRGRLTPTEVIQGVLACALSTVMLTDLPNALDASTLRRLAPGLDDRVSEFLDR